MKYANSLKYVNSFDAAAALADLSQRRVRALCSALGRVNIGSKFIVVPSGSAGHASAVMLESVIKNAGYRVGRITSDSNFDSRTAVFLDGEIADIEDYNKCVAEIKSVVLKMPEEHYFKQEICFALSLLLCQLHGCEFIILEGLSDEHYSLDAVCAPYELVLVPTVYSTDNCTCVKVACEAIKRGVREVVSGNQRNAVYSEISNACMLAGVRLNVTAKPTLCVHETTARRVAFSYADREGYVLKSPSYTLRDCAMLIIESALAIRRAGIKMTWGSISAGLENTNNTGCFDIISISPAVIVDSACDRAEIESMLETFEHTVETVDCATVCIKTSGIDRLSEQLCAFKEKKIEKLIACGVSSEDTSILNRICCDIAVCETAADAAKHVHGCAATGSTVFCIGSVDFSREIKTEFIKLMGL